MKVNSVHVANTVSANGRSALAIALILAFAGAGFGLRAESEPPPDIAKRVAQQEAKNEFYRNNYAYRQTVEIDEIGDKGGMLGHYREVRDVVFSPKGERSEQEVGKPVNTLTRLKLTDEDFRDIREIQPLLLTPDRLFLYDVKYKGEETMDGVPCYVLQVRPKQVLTGMRLFDGMFWVDQSDYSIIRSEGQAVPQIRTTKSENLFPHFTTIRQKVDGKYWFPLKTYADDTLFFRTGAQRIRMVIRYSQYQKFSAETQITFPDQP